MAQIRRDSFDYRVCDDLCEVLLKYLSLEEALRLESVSKQFQRCLFKRQYQLIINKTILDQMNSNHKLVETLVKKLQNIRDLRSANHMKQVSYQWTDRRSNDNRKDRFKSIDLLFQWITKYCKQLHSIDIVIHQRGGQWLFAYHSIKEKTIEEFFRKFGKNLKKIVIFGDFSLILKYCPNLKVIKIPEDLRIVFNDSDINSMKNLKSLELMFDESFSQLIQNNRNNLQNLILRQRPDSDSPLLSHIYQLTHLRQLNIRVMCSEITRADVQQMALNLKGLEILEIDFYPNEDTDNSLAQNCVLKAIKCFRNLKSFTFHFIDFCDSEFLNHCLSESQKLIVLDLRSIDAINDWFFIDIHKHLPQLQVLISINSNISDYAIDSLSMIPSLRKIHFYNLSNNTVITENSVQNLLNNCPKIDSIRLMGSNLMNWWPLKIKSLINENLRRNQTLNNIKMTTFSIIYENNEIKDK